MINKCFLFNKAEFELFIKNFKECYGFNNDNICELLTLEIERSQYQINSSMLTMEAENITFNFLIDWDKKEIKRLSEDSVWSIDEVVWQYRYKKKQHLCDKIYIIIPTKEE